ncbi:Fruit bromelain [Triticum urartu]|uniref:Fruit bromelain n=1 Tax=Triticum urartu TaxID=4572 RepID=M7Z7D5_TRIUA|nr:Fruit bromelain [Triticum urartu]
MARWPPAMLLVLAVALVAAGTETGECIHELVPYEGGFTSGNFVVVDHDIFWSSDCPDPGIDFTLNLVSPFISGRNLVLEEALKGEAFKKRYDEWMARYHRTYKEEAMKKRFEEWMAKYRRTYKDDEEKARRYELFKDCAKMVDKLNVFPGGATTNNFCDYSEDERQASLGAE